MSNARQLVTICCAVVVVVVCTVSTAWPIDPYAQRGEGAFGIKAGLIGRADFDRGDAVFQTEMASTFGLFWDFPFVYESFVSVEVDIHDIRFPGRQEFMIDFAVGPKYAIPFKRLGMVIKPLFLAGIGRLPNFGELTADATTYLTLKGGVEGHFMLPKKRSFLVELGFFYAPTGGNSEIDVTIGPTILARIGFVP